MFVSLFDGVFELFTHVASNRLFVFCFCNSIIAVLHVTSKSDSGGGQAGEIPLSLVVYTSSNKEEGMSTSVSATSNFQEAAGSDEEGNGKNDDENEDHGDGDELRKYRSTATQCKRRRAGALRPSRLVRHGASRRTYMNDFGSNFQEVAGSDEEEDGNSSNENDDENEDHSDGDELRRRIEQFIGTHYRGWAAGTL